MTTVATADGTTVLVFREPLPCCHLRRDHDRSETVLGLPLFDVVAGPQPSPQEWQLVLDHAQAAITAWSQLNE